MVYFYDAKLILIYLIIYLNQYHLLIFLYVFFMMQFNIVLQFIMF